MFDDFSIFDVMGLVGLDPTRIKSSSGYYDCPICGGKKKLNVNVKVGHGGVCRCAKCAAGGDKLDLYLLFHNPRLVSTRSTSESGSVYYRPSEEDRHRGMKEIMEALHIRRSDPNFMRNVVKAKTAATTQQPQISSPEQRNVVYSSFLQLLKLTSAHRTALHDRGLTDQEIERMQFRSTPMFGRTQLAQKLIGQGLSLDGVPGFFKLSTTDEKTGEVHEEWSVYCPDPGYFVPIRNRDGLIVAMQIRLNKPTTDKAKYRFFTSGRETLLNGQSAVSEIHVEMCSQPPRYVVVTEGPIKGYVSRALFQRIFNRDDMALLCVVGTSNFGKVKTLMEWMMRQYPVEYFIEMYDLDKFTNQYVKRDRANLEREMRETILKMRKELANQYALGKPKPKFISISQHHYLGKGIDDHMLALYQQEHEGHTPFEEENP